MSNLREDEMSFESQQEAKQMVDQYETNVNTSNDKDEDEDEEEVEDGGIRGEDNSDDDDEEEGEDGEGEGEEGEEEEGDEEGDDEDEDDDNDDEDDDDEDDDEEDEEEDEDEDDDDDDDDLGGPAGAFANVGQGLVGKDKNMIMQYWQETINSIEHDDHDFKNHQLPLARIKKVMKTDEEVKMISAEAPILFAKGCDIFITELTMRAWIHAEENKRRTLQKSDIAAALQKSDMFDFLIDIVPREEEKSKRNSSRNSNKQETGDQDEYEEDQQLLLQQQQQQQQSEYL
ncbi:hypothetical protein B5S33_g498 [[Candida] boidinii]|nr:hypothetical protein B5S30_g784 [[Candida] boidinii]OWB81878.1 hypothetical protein B5S33_g498 [[Candida] boidinii]GMF49718.1 unnamed protein product [[Candida] boidinii]GMG19965.1 unnamed protein product [[Candida] boidinii]